MTNRPTAAPQSGAAGIRLLRKGVARSAPEPNLRDYDRVAAGFSWEAARAELDGLPAGRGLNIAHEAVDISLHHCLGVDIPESDYPQLASLDGAVRYLGPHLSESASR
jgi:hypothetical protein